MQLIVLDFETGKVQIIKNIPNDITDYEDFVYNKLGYKNSEISWMMMKDGNNVYKIDYNILPKSYD